MYFNFAIKFNHMIILINTITWKTSTQVISLYPFFFLTKKKKEKKKKGNIMSSFFLMTINLITWFVA